MLSFRPLASAAVVVAGVAIPAARQPETNNPPRWTHTLPGPEPAQYGDTTMSVGDGFAAIPLAGSPAKLQFWTALLAKPRTTTP